ncbi:hypothetical protein [Streptomyces sp. 150FB]|uniref:hypothetical protein n=1 Tax=Streptomyces sp. 150FB TaxID=1576605 RepID=UPI001237273A|nr:hypothetical protein [Streptomyces sp. 150FB]
MDSQARQAHGSAHPDADRDWMWETSFLAVVLWRTAAEHDRPLDAVTLADILATCARMTPADLSEDRLPPPAPRVGQFPPARHVPRVAEGVMTLLRQHPGERTLAYTLRALRVDPDQFGGPADGGWATGLKVLRSLLETSREWLDDGRWVVTREDRAVIAATGLDRPIAYDYPPSPAPGDSGHPSVLQRLHRLTHLSVALPAAAARMSRDEHGYVRPLHMVLTGAAVLGMPDTAADLDALWAGMDPSSTQDWEREHVPDALRQAIAVSEDALEEVATFLRSITG